MSHLPLDARAILEYLNELGYRNITAAQLKEFMKESVLLAEKYSKRPLNERDIVQKSQVLVAATYDRRRFANSMQPYSEVPSTTAKSSASAKNSVTPKTTTNNNNKINNNSPSLCKLVKGKRPLVNFNFYLDIKDQQISKKVEERITELGGILEFFLTKSVTHFITDRLPPGVTASSSGSQHQAQGSHNSNGYCVKSPSTGGGVNGGGVGGGGGGVGIGIGIGIGYPITPSPYIQSPQTPATPQTPYTNQTHSGDSATDGIVINHSKKAGSTTSTPNNKKKISRADAMLHRALQSQQQCQYSGNQLELEEKRPILEQGAYRIWHLDYAVRFLKKVTADVKQYLKKSQQPTKGACEPILLKGNFIKIETIARSSRPYYSVFRKIEWPKIQFREDGAFRLTPREDESKSAKEKPLKSNAMTRKSRSSSKHNHNHMRLKAKQVPKQVIEKPATVDNSSEKQCGVCEICKIEYDTLTIHLKTKDHEFFARNQSNYLALDSLIKSSSNVDKFLEENTKVEPKEQSVEPMEVDEETCKQTRKSSRIQTPPPVVKIKTKLKEVEVVTEKKPYPNNVKRSSKSTTLLDSPPIRHPLPTSTLYKVVEETKAQTDPVSPKKSSIIVKFRKIRQTQLAVLNGEAENFMFPRRPASSERATDSDRQTSTDSNRISSSSISSESHLTEEPVLVPTIERAGSATAKRRKTIADNSHKSNASTKVTTVCYQSFPNTPIQPSKATPQPQPTIENVTRSVTQKATTSQRGRRAVGGRRRGRGTSRNQGIKRTQRRGASEDRMGDEGNTDDEEEDEGTVLELNLDESKESPEKTKKKKKRQFAAIDVNQGRFKEQKYAFERLPVKELWYEAFRRQDAGQARMFEYWGSTSYRKLPYEMGALPMRTLAACKICTPKIEQIKKEIVAKPMSKRVEKLKKVKKERSEGRERRSKSKSNTPEPQEKTTKMKPHNKHLNKATFLGCDLMPRKSPREHASTLAILSCLIKQRKDSEVDESPPPQPSPPPREKTPTPERRKTPSPAIMSTSRISTPEPLQFVSEISENVKRLRRGQRKFDDFVPTAVMCPTTTAKKPRRAKPGGLEFEVDEKRLKSLEVKQKSSVQLEYEIDAYLGRVSMKTLRETPTPPLAESSSSGFIEDFSSDINLIDLIDCYDGGGGGGGGGEGNGDENNSDQPQHRPAGNNVYNLFAAHNRRRKNNKINKTGWPTTRRRNIASTRQNHLLQKRDRFRFFCDYQTRQKDRLMQGSGMVTTTTSMTPPDTDMDDKEDDCTRSPMPEHAEEALLSKEEILANGYMSPSEKADNSDIFTVSSDGLDTDLEVSCSHIIKTEDIDDECTTSSTLAAPPASPEPVTFAKTPPLPPLPPATRSTTQTPPTIAKKKNTPVITSIIQKEVKVSCKRLRTPFRRFRQRR